MERVNRTALKKILDDFFEVAVKTKSGEIKIYYEACLLTISESGKSSLEYKYALYSDGNEIGFQNFEELSAALVPFTDDGETLTLSSIGNEKFSTLSEAEANKAFEHITMSELLHKYPQADRFSLTCVCNCRISDEEADGALKKLEAGMRGMAKSQYDMIRDKSGLCDFDMLYKEIVEECRAYRKKHAAKIKKNDGHAFFCDEFTWGRTKYTAPQGLWHLYHCADFIESCAYRLKVRNTEQSRPDDWEIENIPALKNSAIGREITFTWHCTTTQLLHKVFTFRLDADSRAWLLTHKDDYDFGEKDNYLQDLALYNGDEILFSSCTHEGFHVGCRANNT